MNCDFIYSRKEIIITPPNDKEEKIKFILQFYYNISVHTDFDKFICFLKAYFEIKNFSCMPYAEKAKVLLQDYQVEVSTRTLATWCKNFPPLIKGLSSSLWKTTVEKERILVDGDEELEKEAKKFFERRRELGRFKKDTYGKNLKDAFTIAQSLS